jgi:hypothetical protein
MLNVVNCSLYFLSPPYLLGNWDSSVNIVTGYDLDVQGSIPGRGKDFSPLHGVPTNSRDHPANYTMGIGGALSSRLKQQGREAGHPPPSSAKIKNGGIYLHSPTHCHVVVLN